MELASVVPPKRHVTKAEDIEMKFGENNYV